LSASLGQAGSHPVPRIPPGRAAQKPSEATDWTPKYAALGVCFMARAVTERSPPSHQISPSSDAKLATEKFRWLFLISIKLQRRQNRLTFFEGINTPHWEQTHARRFPALCRYCARFNVGVRRVVGFLSGNGGNHTALIAEYQSPIYFVSRGCSKLAIKS